MDKCGQDITGERGGLIEYRRRSSTLMLPTTMKGTFVQTLRRLIALMFVTTMSLWAVGGGVASANGDTDGDGLSDFDEVNIWFTNHLVPDTDGDGLSDGDEVNTWLTEPLVPDTDTGGVNDGDEVTNGTDPLDDSDDNGPLVDVDIDGYSLAQGDCDDTDPEVNPGELEVVDGKDNDCDGTADNALKSTVLADVPGEGIATAPGLQKVFNPKSQAASHAGGSQAPGRGRP